MNLLIRVKPILSKKDGQISQVAEKDEASEAAEEADCGGGSDCQKCQQVALALAVFEVEQEVAEREATNCGGGGKEEERRQAALQVRPHSLQQARWKIPSIRPFAYMTEPLMKLLQMSVNLTSVLDN